MTIVPHMHKCFIADSALNRIDLKGIDTNVSHCPKGIETIY